MSKAEDILAKARQAIMELPEEQREALLELYDETVARHNQLQETKKRTDAELVKLAEARAELKKTWAKFDDSLADLRIRVKMLLHDAECRSRDK